MADSTLQFTNQAMQIRVADYLGIASRAGSTLALPVDAKNVELVQRLVNDGYRRVLTENENWNFLNVPLLVSFYSQQSYTITAKTTSTLVVTATSSTPSNTDLVGYEITAIDTDTDPDVEYPMTVTGASGTTSRTLTFATGTVSSNLEAGDTLKLAGPRNVAGKAWRYYMPDDFYGIWKQQLTFDEQGPRVRIDIVTEEELRELRAGSRTTGDAIAVAFRPINTTATSTGKRWEALFWPEPSGTQVVSGIYKRFPAALSSNGDVSVAGYHHDGTVLAAALAAAELERNDKIGVHEQTYQVKLATSKKLDARATPRKNRNYGDGSDGPGFMRPSSDARPASYNGTALA